MNKIVAIALCAALSTAAPVEAQRLGSGGAGQRHDLSASNRAGRGQAAQRHEVRREANTSINHNVNRNLNRNVNVNRDVNVDVDVHHDYHGYHDWDDDDFHPWAVAAVATTAAVATAAIIGSYHRSLPSGCVTVIRANVSYYQCGTTWFQPVYSGTTVQYVVVAAP